MERLRLARKRWPLWFACTATAGAELLLYLLVTRHAVSAALAGRPLEGSWGWASILGWHTLIALAGLALVWPALAESLTRFDAEGIWRPRLFRAPVLLRWAEAESVFVSPPRGRPQLVKINAPRASVEINALHYREPDALLALIEERMGATVGARTTDASPRCDARR